MIVGIVGSRNFKDYDLLVEKLKQFEFLNGKITKIVSGGAVGADQLGVKWAKSKNIPYLEFLPDWKKYGKSAGFVRNCDIVKNSDYIIAFWDGFSKGTKNSLELAKKINKNFLIVEFKDYHQ